MCITNLRRTTSMLDEQELEFINAALAASLSTKKKARLNNRRTSSHAVRNEVTISSTQHNLTFLKLNSWNHIQNNISMCHLFFWTRISHVFQICKTNNNKAKLLTRYTSRTNTETITHASYVEWLKMMPRFFVCKSHTFGDCLVHFLPQFYFGKFKDHDLFMSKK